MRERKNNPTVSWIPINTLSSKTRHVVFNDAKRASLLLGIWQFRLMCENNGLILLPL